MAEEVRLFVRSLVYLVPLTIVYWIVSDEPAGTVLLGFLVVATLAFAVVVVALAPQALGDLLGRDPVGGLVGVLNRAIGFHERVENEPPLRARSELVPLASPWPLIAAGALAIVALGLVFGAWLLLPGLVLLVVAGVAWLTELDRA